MFIYFCPLLQIETIELPMDPKTNKRRGFVFITFKEEDPVKKIMEKKFHNVSGTKDANGKESLVSLQFGTKMLMFFGHSDWSIKYFVVLTSVRDQDRSAEGGVSAAAVRWSLRRWRQRQGGAWWWW